MAVSYPNARSHFADKNIYLAIFFERGKNKI